MDASEHLYRSIGQLVRAGRKEAELTQDELAQRVGLTRTSINNIEHGRQKIQVHTLYALAEALSVPASALLPPTGSQQPSVSENQLPKDLLPEEREWVRRVLTPEGGS